MSQNEMENKATQNNSSGSQGSYWDRKERRRELKRELRELRHGHPGHGIFAGVLLLLLGCLFLAGNFLFINVGQWWPIVLVIVGVSILVRSFYWWD
jgi:hypothetical protein